MENKVLAIVNGVEITEEGLNAIIMRYPKEKRNFFMNEEGRKQLLDQVISLELMYNYGKESGYEKEPEYIYSLERAEKEILTQVSVNKLLNGVTVSEEEEKKFYDDNVDLFVEEETVKASHILVETLAEIIDIKDKIDNGMNFGDAAKEFSKCPSGSSLGDLGEFKRGVMVKEFEDVAFSQEVGEVSEPVKTQFGYHLILVTNKNTGKKKTFEESKKFINETLLTEKQNNLYVDFTNGLKKNYDVIIK